MAHKSRTAFENRLHTVYQIIYTHKSVVSINNLMKKIRLYY